MIAVHDPELAERLRRLRQHAMDVSDLARHSAHDVVIERYPERGFNYRMTDMQAALGLCQLEVLDEILERRRAPRRALHAALARVPALEVPYDPPYAARTWQSYCVRVTPAARRRAHRADAAAARRRDPHPPRDHGDPPGGRLRRPRTSTCPTPRRRRATS